MKNRPSDIDRMIDNIMAGRRKASTDKKEYIFIKDTDHSDYPGPGFHRTETGWSNKGSGAKPGQSKVIDPEKKQKPIVVKVDELEPGSTIVEGLTNGSYFKVRADLKVDTANNVAKDRVEKIVAESLEKHLIKDAFPLDRKSYLKVIKDLLVLDIKKIYVIK